MRPVCAGVRESLCIIVRSPMADALLLSAGGDPSTLRNHEFDLLCACATARPRAEQIARLASWNFTGLDWEAFLRLADHHGLSALVSRSLIEHARELSAERKESLRSIYQQNLRRSLWFAAELTRILRHFSLRGLAAIPYKGPVLALSAYGDIGLRSFSDLDILISPRDFERAQAALAEIQYRPTQQLSPAVERLFLKTGYERSFDGPAGKNLLELQWNLLPHFYAVDPGIEVEHLLARAAPVEICGSSMLCLSPEDSFLALCLHAAKHLWTRLIWVADIAESCRVSGIHPEVIVERARVLGVARIVGISCWLAEQILGASVPVAVRALAAGDREVALLGKQCRARLSHAAGYSLESSEYFRQILKLRERSRDRRRYLWRLVWTPGPGEIAAVPLPEVLFPLYHVVRIGRLLRRASPGASTGS
jgi:Uncharacterised nucleotidyltransferase